MLSALAQRLCGRRPRRDDRFSSASSRPPAAGRTLAQLATVELHSIMRFLQQSDILVASSTCRRMLAVASEPALWKAVSEFECVATARTPPPLPASLVQRLKSLLSSDRAGYPAPDAWQRSSLLRRYSPVRYVPYRREEDAGRIVEDLARFGVVRALEPPVDSEFDWSTLAGPRWSAPQVAAALALPGTVHLRKAYVSGAWLEPPQLRTLCALPRLSELVINCGDPRWGAAFDGEWHRKVDAFGPLPLDPAAAAHGEGDDGEDDPDASLDSNANDSSADPNRSVLDSSALARAKELWCVELFSPMRRASCYRGLASIPHLESFTLRLWAIHDEHGDEIPGGGPLLDDGAFRRLPELWGLSRLTHIHFPHFDAEGRIGAEDIEVVLKQLPLLRWLQVPAGENLDPCYEALVSLGPAALPALRHWTVILHNSRINHALLRHFRALFPLVRVCWQYSCESAPRREIEFECCFEDDPHGKCPRYIRPVPEPVGVAVINAPPAV